MTHVEPSPRDVRMRGFAHRAPPSEGLAWIDDVALALPVEPAPLAEVAGRVLAEAVTAPIDVPSFDRSAMDGYALCGAETDGAGLYNPLSFRVIGESMPGAGFDGTREPGTAVRIMTGAMIPDGADAVLPAEHTREADGLVEITESVPPGRHVGRRGEDIATGSVVLPAGRRLRPQDVGLLASMGFDTVAVHRRPVVRLVITGSELVPPGNSPGPGQIFESNSTMLAALVQRDGGRLEQHPVDVIPDDRDRVRTAIAGPGADVILVSGGSSVGSEDHAPTLVAELGELTFHGFAMRPSSPAGMGQVPGALVFLLPGNPVSCLCAYDFFAGRAIRALGRRDRRWPYPSRNMALAAKIASALGREDYCRVRLVEDPDADGATRVEPLALSGASILSSTTRADGFVVVPASSEGFAEGTVVTVFLYDPPATAPQTTPSDPAP